MTCSVSCADANASLENCGIAADGLSSDRDVLLETLMIPYSSPPSYPRSSSRLAVEAGVSVALFELALGVVADKPFDLTGSCSSRASPRP